MVTIYIYIYNMFTTIKYLNINVEKLLRFIRELITENYEAGLTFIYFYHGYLKRILLRSFPPLGRDRKVI